MMKYWRITNQVDSLPWYVFAPDQAGAIKALEVLTGGLPPQRTRVEQLPTCPAGFQLDGTTEPQILLAKEEDDED